MIRSPKARYVYEANADYLHGEPTVDGPSFIKVENQALALETGKTDYASLWGKEMEAVQAFEDDQSYDDSSTVPVSGCCR